MKTVMDPEALGQMRETCKEIWCEAAGQEFPKELLDELLSHLKEFRLKAKKEAEGSE